MSQLTHMLVTVLLCGSCFAEEGERSTSEPASESTSSVGSGDMSTSSSSSSSDTGPADGSTIGSGDASSSGESTGNEVADWALSFDGSSLARKETDAGVYQWSANEFTFEAWVQILDVAAIGSIFDAQDDALLNGWAFYIHPKSEQLIFSFFNDQHQNQPVIGPSIQEVGVGWHHLAASKVGAMSLIFVDGSVVAAGAVSPLVSAAPIVWTLGGHVTDSPDFALTHVVIDDVRVSEGALYDQEFSPPVDLDALASTALLLRLDEGAGIVAADAGSGGNDFVVGVPQWAPGYPPG